MSKKKTMAPSEPEYWKAKRNWQKKQAELQLKHWKHYQDFLKRLNDRPQLSEEEKTRQRLEDEVAVLEGLINMYQAEYDRIIGFRDPRTWPEHSTNMRD